jgi:hypothetical protein
MKTSSLFGYALIAVCLMGVIGMQGYTGDNACVPAAPACEPVIDVCVPAADVCEPAGFAFGQRLTAFKLGDRLRARVAVARANACLPAADVCEPVGIAFGPNVGLVEMGTLEKIVTAETTTSYTVSYAARPRFTLRALQFAPCTPTACVPAAPACEPACYPVTSTKELCEVAESCELDCDTCGQANVRTPIFRFRR